MAKNAKKSHQAPKKQASQNKTNSKNAKAAQAQAPVMETALPEPEPQPNEPVPEVKAQVLLGAISGELFESIFKPIFSSFDERHDDEPLRALVESIVTAIAMRDVYDGCRKLDDIFQRYLYYLESLTGDVDSDLNESRALCDYWRNQVLITLIHDSRIVFDLLFPADPVSEVPTSLTLRNDLLRGLRHVLSCRIGGPTGDTKREQVSCIPIVDFSRGISFPWLNFTPARLFGLLNRIPDHLPDEPVEHEFALVMPPQVSLMAQALRSAIEETMLLDLVAAQHSKLFAEITAAYEPDDRLPTPILDTIKKRVRFDKVYQSAFDQWMNGEDVSKPLHRSSRINIDEMNAVSKLYRVLRDADERHLAVYLFHYYGT